MNRLLRAALATGSAALPLPVGTGEIAHEKSQAGWLADRTDSPTKPIALANGINQASTSPAEDGRGRTTPRIPPIVPMVPNDIVKTRYTVIIVSQDRPPGEGLISSQGLARGEGNYLTVTTAFDPSETTFITDREFSNSVNLSVLRVTIAGQTVLSIGWITGHRVADMLTVIPRAGFSDGGTMSPPTIYRPALTAKLSTAINSVDPAHITLTR